MKKQAQKHYLDRIDCHVPCSTRFSRPKKAHAATASVPYTFNSVNTGAGGGYVDGIVFNKTEKDLIYARTDVGGAYRWDKIIQQLDPDHRYGWLERFQQIWCGCIGNRPCRSEPGVSGNRLVHEQLGRAARFHHEVDRQGKYLADDYAPVQGWRQHAGPWQGRAFDGRSE